MWCHWILCVTSYHLPERHLFANRKQTDNHYFTVANCHHFVMCHSNIRCIHLLVPQYTLQSINMYPEERRCVKLHLVLYSVWGTCNISRLMLLFWGRIVRFLVLLPRLLFFLFSCGYLAIFLVFQFLFLFFCAFCLSLLEALYLVNLASFVCHP